MTDGRSDRRSDRFTIASTALTAMLTRCKNPFGAFRRRFPAHSVIIGLRVQYESSRLIMTYASMVSMSLTGPLLGLDVVQHNVLRDQA